MLISSVYFMLFFPFALFIYYKLPESHKNTFLLILSYALYLYGGIPYGLFMLFATFVTYRCGLLLGNAKGQVGKRRVILVITILLNLSDLVFFKYFNTLSLPALQTLAKIGFHYSENARRLLAPLGISFYTFQTIGYVADVYTQKIQPEQSFSTYSLFVSFFPQVAMGPIGRADKLLPQLHSPRPFVYLNITNGMRRMAFGFFKKFAVADVLAVYVNTAHSNIEAHSGSILFIIAVLYTFQLYADFSGYADIAIGCAEAFGLKLEDNFKTPFFATSITKFWNRWHISLSSWFKDYIYIPLGGSRKGRLRYYLNLAIVFLVSGIWHGDSLNYLVWGATHAFIRVVEALIESARRKKSGTNKPPAPSTPATIAKTAFTFFYFTFSLVIFKLPTVQGGIQYFVRMFSKGTSPVTSQLFSFVQTGFDNTPIIAYGFVAFSIITFIMLCSMEWYTCFVLKNGSLAKKLGSLKPATRWACYYILVAVIFAAFLMQSGGLGDSSAFIYAQF